MAYREYQKKEIGWGLNAFNRPVEYSGVDAWVKLFVQLLFMQPGTYPTAPGMGVGLQNYRYRFTDEVIVELQEKINSQCELYLSGIPISSVRVSTREYKGDDVIVISAEMAVSDGDLQTVVVAVDTASKTLDYAIAF